MERVFGRDHPHHLSFFFLPQLHPEFVQRRDRDLHPLCRATGIDCRANVHCRLLEVAEAKVFSSLGLGKGREVSDSWRAEKKMIV